MGFRYTILIFCTRVKWNYADKFVCRYDFLSGIDLPFFLHRTSGAASARNDLGRSSTSKLLHSQSEAPRHAARLQAPAAAVHGHEIR